MTRVTIGGTVEERVGRIAELLRARGFSVEVSAPGEPSGDPLQVGAEPIPFRPPAAVVIGEDVRVDVRLGEPSGRVRVRGQSRADHEAGELLGLSVIG